MSNTVVTIELVGSQDSIHRTEQEQFESKYHPKCTKVIIALLIVTLYFLVSKHCYDANWANQMHNSLVFKHWLPVCTS